MARLNKPVINQLKWDDAKPIIQDTTNKSIDQLNSLSQGSISAVTSANTAPPTGPINVYAQGDFIRNSAPTVLGAAGSHYIITGWTCVTPGAPGVWVQTRALTGT